MAASEAFGWLAQECGKCGHVAARAHERLKGAGVVERRARRHDDDLRERGADVEARFFANLGHQDFRGVAAGRFRVERTRDAISP